ncbi:MAG: Rv3235 family protein [Mycobacteriales bacterium]|nr:Rv3235 family protein [Frankia sp.]
MTAAVVDERGSADATPPRIRLHVRAVPAIDPDPPYDDESDAPAPPRPWAARWPVDGSSALVPEFTAHVPGQLRLVEPTEPSLRLVAPVGDEPDDFDPVRTVPDRLPPLAARATMMVRAVLEVLAGDRPAAQLMRWASDEVYADLERRAARRGPRPWAATLRNVHISEPAPGVAEIAAVIRRGTRVAALAMRMEGLDGRWLLTAVDLG